MLIRFDLLCHVAFNAPLRTRRERADRLKMDRKDFFDKYAPEARCILEELLEKYAQHGTAQFVNSGDFGGPAAQRAWQRAGDCGQVRRRGEAARGDCRIADLVVCCGVNQFAL